MVVDALKLRVLLLHLLKYGTLNEHEPRGTVKHLGKSILDLGLLVLKFMTRDDATRAKSRPSFPDLI
jgi:hypothetical protein